MSKVEDPFIKLFGKTIKLLHIDDHDHDIVLDKANEHIKMIQTEDTSPDESTSSRINNDDPKTPTTEKETSSKTKKDSNIDEKPQKPDEILPCPRCNSMDTKFCYYNNYNVSQPRHFCKNCQRYWTAGGTMRNTPVGSGRRKIKTLQQEQATTTAKSSFKTNLNFGSHVPLQIQCFPSPQWPYNNPLNSSQNRPISFYPPPPSQYWGYNVNQVQVQPTSWSMQWIPPNYNDQISPNSPFRKHSRDGSLVSSSSISNEENCNNSINGGSLFKAFQ